MPFPSTPPLSQNLRSILSPFIEFLSPPLFRCATNMADPQPSSSAAPIRVAGSEIDAALANSQFLTEAEVLSRRSRRLKQLTGIYRDHYWALMEQLKSQHRRYYWLYGKSPFVEDNENGPSDLNWSAATAGDVRNGNLGVTRGKGNDESASTCKAQGCRVKAMALTDFCLMHILSDPNQQLYKPCRFPINKTSTAEPIFCGKPAMASTSPLYCPVHFDKAEKFTARALRNAGHIVSPTSKTAPKLHTIIPEYVRQIQLKRRAAHMAQKAQRANLGIAEVRGHKFF